MRRLFAILLLALAIPLASQAADDLWAGREKNGVIELKWEELVPADFNPDELFEKYNVDELEDDDPKARKILREMQEMWSHAPVVESLNGRRVKLPGFVIPLEGDGKRVTEFLLVPYFGACIHVPPPPSNQIIYVKTGPKGAAVRNMYDTVWVTGRLITVHQVNALGDAGYTLEADTVEPYEE